MEAQAEGRAAQIQVPRQKEQKRLLVHPMIANPKSKGNSPPVEPKLEDMAYFLKTSSKTCHGCVFYSDLTSLVSCPEVRF
jgi:hypothetical protein